MSEGAPSWEHILITAITTVPAVIAAFSSIRNGRVLKNGQGSGPRYIVPGGHHTKSKSAGNN